MPTALEVFAHDATIFAEMMVKRNPNLATRKELRDAIANFKGRAGLLPSLSFLKSGELDAPEVGFVVADGVVQALPAPSIKS
jgi:hypothetical protein